MPFPSAITCPLHEVHWNEHIKRDISALHTFHLHHRTENAILFCRVVEKLNDYFLSKMTVFWNVAPFSLVYILKIRQAVEYLNFSPSGISAHFIPYSLEKIRTLGNPTPTSYSAGLEWKYWSADRPSWLKRIVFFSALPRKCHDNILTLGQNSFFFHIFTNSLKFHSLNNSTISKYKFKKQTSYFNKFFF
jgi:hypothetical protein